ncbi:MAG: aspartate kinase [Holophagales bacterium]|nr:aspartate kinase [Holophagales bacterium]
MPILVQKLGGTSVADLESLCRVAVGLIASRRAGHGVVVVVSAMGDTTDRLYQLATGLCPDPPARELDLLFACGEQISSSLLAMAIRARGVEAVALTGPQSGIVTSRSHGNAEIVTVRCDRIRRELSRGRIVVVAGFQGRIEGGDEITTLGRGGSDTTAIALAAALEAGSCTIFSDVDGVYSADPRLVPGARRLDELSYEVMGALAWHGAQVLHVDAVEMAARHGVEILVRSSFGGPGSTRIGPLEPDTGAAAPGIPRIHGVAARKDLLAVSGGAPLNGGTVARRVAELAGSPRAVLSNEADPRAGDFRLWVAGVSEVRLRQLARELGRLRVRGGLGTVTAVGRGLEGWSERVPRGVLEPYLGCFASPCSASWVIETTRVDEGLRELHRRLIEPAPSSTTRHGAPLSEALPRKRHGGRPEQALHLEPAGLGLPSRETPP